MSVQDFRDLRVWQMGTDLAEEIYRITQCFPGHEVYGLVGQMRRAAVSVPSNIAEGHARGSTGEYLHHISIAQGSLAELRTQIELSQRLAYTTHEDVERALEYGLALARQLNALKNALITH
jgi:four helix bundle protein